MSELFVPLLLTLLLTPVTQVLTHGTPRCDKCYTLVEEAVRGHRSSLDQLSQLIDDLLNSPALPDDGRFQRRLTEMTANIQHLLRECRRATSSDDSPLDLLSDLQERIEEVKKVAGSLVEYMQQAHILSGEGEQAVGDAERILSGLDKSLRDVIRYLETDGASALRRAIQQSRQFGIQSEHMGEIARQARKLAEEHHAQANLIANMANFAVGNATLAYDIAFKVLEHQSNFSEAVRILETGLSSTELIMSQTRQLASQSQREANEAYEVALGVFTEARAGLAQVDVNGLKRRAADLKEQGQRLKSDLELLNREYGPLLDRLDSAVESSFSRQQLFSRLQLTSDQLLQDCLAARDQAVAAVKAGERTLQEARRTLSTLQGFDRQVQESRDQAETALRQVQEIRSLVERAEQRTRAAGSALSGAERDAKLASHTASKAEAAAVSAQGEAKRIQEEASVARSHALDLQKEAISLNSHVGITEQKIYTYEQQVSVHAALAREALDRADQAKSNALSASERVRDALRTCRQIRTALDAADQLDAAALDQLQLRLEAAEQLMESAQLQLRIEEMRSFRSFQNRMARNYEEDLNYLRKEVVIIEEISRSLPDGCYSLIKLEP